MRIDVSESRHMLREMKQILRVNVSSRKTNAGREGDVQAKGMLILTEIAFSEGYEMVRRGRAWRPYVEWKKKVCVGVEMNDSGSGGGTGRRFLEGDMLHRRGPSR